MFVVGSTVAVTTMEYEPGGVATSRRCLTALSRSPGEYAHDERNDDTNGTRISGRR